MTSLATASDLAVYLQTATSEEATAGSPDVLDTLVAEQAIASASAKIRGAAGWAITEDVYTKRVTTASPEIVLPAMNVTAIAVTVAGTAWSAEQVSVDQASGVVSLSGIRNYGVPLDIAYTAGFDPVPEGVKALCLEIAAGIYTNPTGDVLTTYGSVTEQHRPPATAANPEDLRVDARLAPYVVGALA